MTRRKTDGERLTQRIAKGLSIDNWPDAIWIAQSIDRLVRHRMGEAWDEGWFDRDCHEADWHENPYRGGEERSEAEDENLSSDGVRRRNPDSSGSADMSDKQCAASNTKLIIDKLEAKP